MSLPTPHAPPCIYTRATNTCLHFTSKPPFSGLGYLFQEGKAGKKRHVLLHAHFFCSHLLPWSHHGPLGTPLWRGNSSFSSTEQPWEFFSFPVPPSLAFMSSLSGQGPPLPPPSPEDSPLKCPQHPRPLPGALHIPLSPPPQARLLSSLSGRSVAQGADTHESDPPGRLGVAFCCGKAKLPSAGALICRQLQTSVGPRLTQPINNGIRALTQTDSPKLSEKGRQRVRGGHVEKQGVTVGESGKQCWCGEQHGRRRVRRT